MARHPRLLAVFAVLLFGVFVAGDILTTAPTYDEPAHLVAGYSYLKTGDFRLNPEHPPLLKMIAAAPLLLTGTPFPGSGHAREPWAMAVTNVHAQWSVAHFWLESDAPFLPARLAVALLGILLAVLIFFWSQRVWGTWGGAISVTLFALDPNFIAHSAVVTTDAGVALLIFATIYFFWRWQAQPTLPFAALFALSFALAQLAKFSAIVLVPIVVVLAIRSSVAWRNVPGQAPRPWKTALLLTMTAIMSIAAIWAAYGFRWSAATDPARAAAEEAMARATPQHRRLDVPQSLPPGYFPLRAVVQEWAAKESGDETAMDPSAPQGFAQRAILFAARHHLLPEAYLFGAAWSGSMSVFRASFLNGEYSVTGFRPYFFWTFLYKTPVPAILAIGAGLWLARRKAGPFLFWPVVFYLGISLIQNLNIGHRHLLPIFPFLYVACGSLSQIRATAARGLGVVLLATLIAGDVWMYGRHLSYMNVPDGWRRLTDSNFDWGQDLERLGKWVRENDVRTPVNLVYFGTADPRWYGIAHHNLRTLKFSDPPQVPGYFAISSADYLGVFFPPERRTYWRDYLERAGARRVGTAGSTIFIYRIEKRP